MKSPTSLMIVVTLTLLVPLLPIDMRAQECVNCADNGARDGTVGERKPDRHNEKGKPLLFKI